MTHLAIHRRLVALAGLVAIGGTAALAACDTGGQADGGSGGGAVGAAESGGGAGDAFSPGGRTSMATGPGGGVAGPGASGDTATTGEPGSESTAVGPNGTGGGSADGGGGGAPPPACDPLADGFTATATVVVDDSNSYASPLLVKELVADAAWTIDAPLPVRPHEFLNYYARGFERAPLDASLDGLRLGADAEVIETTPGYDLAELLVTVASDGAIQALPPDVTFLLDTSTSMGDEGTRRLEGVIFGADAAIRPQQSVAVLTSSATDRVVRAMTPWNGDVMPILDAAGRLTADADFSVSLRDALSVARAQALVSRKPGIVVAITDGSTALDPAVAQEVSAARGEDPPIRVVGIGVGPAPGYVDDVLDELTDRSGGAYFYAPDAETAERELTARFDELTRIAARDVAIQLELPDGVRLAGVTGGPGSAGEGVLAEGQNLGLGGTMAFHVYLKVAHGLEPCTGVGVRLRWTDAESGELRVHPEPETELPLVLRLDHAFTLGDTRDPALPRASAIVAAAEALRGPTPGRLARAATRLQRAAKMSPEPQDVLGELCGQVLEVCARTGAVCDDCTTF